MSTHLGKKVIKRANVKQRRSLWCLLWALSSEFIDAVSPNWRFSFCGAMPVLEIES